MWFTHLPWETSELEPGRTVSGEVPSRVIGTLMSIHVPPADCKAEGTATRTVRRDKQQIPIDKTPPKCTVTPAASE